MLSGFGKLTALMWVLLTLFVANTFAQDDLIVSDKAGTPQVQAQLVASVDAVAPGSEIYLGVNKQSNAHVHTYCTKPGDSGNATTVNWSLPDGATASDIIWPVPSRFPMGPITNYAYENNVTLHAKI